MSHQGVPTARSASEQSPPRAAREGLNRLAVARLGAPAGTREWATQAHALDDLPCDRIFLEMLTAYRPTGGVARLDTLTRDASRPSPLQLIAEGVVFSFEWQQVFWVPMFQFTRPELAPRAEVRQVLLELADVFDGWSLSTWFALPNCWLKGQRPVDLLDAQMALVLAAARVDHFIANG